jgi:hypothetical protein
VGLKLAPPRASQRRLKAKSRRVRMETVTRRA